MDRKGKEREVENLSERLKKAKAVIFADFLKLKVSEMTELRSQLRKSEAVFKVIKNRLARRVLEKEGLKELDEYVTGPTAVATSISDPASVAKVLVEFAKEHEFLKVRGGFAEGKILSTADINTLAKLPSREVLLSKMLASMNAPATNFTMVLAAIPQKLVRAINAIKEKKT
jgi:large subunit ribosomal protein L10